MNDKGPGRPSYPPAWMMLTLMALAFCGVVFAGARHHGLAGMDRPSHGLLLLSLATVAWLMVLAATPDAQTSIPAEFQPWLAVALIAAAVKLLLPLEPGFLFLSKVCFRKGALYGALAVALFGFLLRRLFAAKPQFAGATAGVLGGLAGFITSQLFCPVLEASHVLTAHLTQALVFGVLGLLTGTVLWLSHDRQKL